MANFEEEFASKCSILDSAVKDLINQSRSQYNDATCLVAEKGKAAVELKYTKKVLVDTVFSLKTVCDQLFDATLKIIEKQSNLDVDRLANGNNDNSRLNEVTNRLDKFEDFVKNKFETLLKCMPQSCNDDNDDFPQLNTESTSTVVDNKNKHVIVLKEKDSDAKYDSASWSTVVKNTIQKQLKHIPVDRSVLSKSGDGCLFFPNKQAQEEAKTALQPLFDLTSDSRPRKGVMPKIKVFDVDTEVYNNKAALKKAIIEKNPDINDLIEKDADFDVVLINSSFNFAILKVTPVIRKYLIKRGKLYLGMYSTKVRDHFQPLQCYACQQYGHKKGSPECKHYEKDTSTCLYCCGNHMSKECCIKHESRQHRCANCWHSDSEHHKVNASHKSTSIRCPFAIREMNALIKRTMGLNGEEAKKLLVKEQVY